MTADIDAVLSRLRERPECRDAVEAIEELAGRTEFVRGLLRDAARAARKARAERDRLRSQRDEARAELQRLTASAADLASEWESRRDQHRRSPGGLLDRADAYDLCADELRVLLAGDRRERPRPRPHRGGGVVADRSVPDALARLAGRPEIAEYVALVAAEVNRLTAKVERLWDLLDEAHDSLPWCECCDVMGRPCSIGAALGESTPAPIDDRTERWIEKVQADAKPGPKHALSESTPEVPSDG